MSNDNRLERHFDYGSFLPILLFVFGIYISFLFISQKYSQGVFILLISFIIYVINNVIINYKEKIQSEFNQYLEEIAVFVTFGLTPIIFGLDFYEGDMIILVVVFFYAICQILNLARNFVLNAKNTRGWPAPLNGLFFPFTFYIYIFYLQGSGDSVFIIYFILIAVLLVSEYNFLGYERDELENLKFKEFEFENLSNVDTKKTIVWAMFGSDNKKTDLNKKEQEDRKKLDEDRKFILEKEREILKDFEKLKKKEEIK